jgi:hypothetical protein
VAAPPIAARVARCIERHGLLDPRRGVLLLVSGGADSTLALVLLHELGVPLRALHVAHGLRGADSDADAAACADRCAQLDVPCAIVAGSVPPGPNLEARLRDVRRERRSTPPGVTVSPPGTPPRTRPRRRSTAWPARVACAPSPRSDRVVAPGSDR